MSDLSDADARRQVRDSADRLAYNAYDVIQRRTDRDVLWSVPGDLAEHGDGTGLAHVYEQQLINPLQELLDRARAEVAQVREAIEERKRRVIGPNYRPGATQ